MTDDAVSVVSYPRDTILTREEVAKALRVGVRQVDKADLPTIYLGPATPRFHWGSVLDALISRGRA